MATEKPSDSRTPEGGGGRHLPLFNSSFLNLHNSNGDKKLADDTLVKCYNPRFTLQTSDTRTEAVFVSFKLIFRGFPKERLSNASSASTTVRNGNIAVATSG